MAADRSVTVHLRAVVNDFKRGMDEASKSTQRVGSAAGDAEQKTSLLSRAGSAIGGALKTGAIVATTAVVGLGAAALKTGWSYNQLEQNSRAALTTLLGSGEAAHAQMDRLSEFVRTALFPREVFIEAQQLLLAFGFAAEDVIPALSAIQEAVAATGGSSQTFMEVANVLAKVQSTGQITAGTLNELGRRGINAAQLIGDAMGMTEEQIRSSITRGTLDGREALDILVQAMEQRFGGAAELISQTWQGASGMVAAAMRDIGSSLAEPFIAKQGGGAAIDWANALGDLLWAIHGQLDPIIQTLQQRAGPAFDAITDGILNAAAAIERLDTGRLTDDFLSLSPAIAGLGAAGVAAATGLGPLARLGVTLNPVAAGLTAVVAASPELRGVLQDLFAALVPLIQPAARIAVILGDSFVLAIQGLALALEPIVSLVAAAATAFSNLPGSMQLALTVLGGLAMLRGPLGDVGARIGLIPDYLRHYASRFGQAAGAVGGFSGAMGRALTFLGGPWGLAIGAAVTVGGLFMASQRNKKEATEEFTRAIEADSGALDENTEAAIANRIETDGLAGLAERAGVSFETVAGAIVGNTEATEELTRRHQELSDEYYHLLGLGDQLSPHERERLNALRDQLGAISDLIPKIDDQAGAMDIARGKYEEGQIILEAVADALGETGDAADGAKGPTEDFGDAMSGVATETGNAEEALEGYLDAVKRATDPVYALDSAIRGVEDAQRDGKRASEDLSAAEKELQELHKSGKASREDIEAAERKVEDAQLKVDESAWKVARALDEAERAALSGELSFEDFEARLQTWVRQGDLTQAQADNIRDRVADLRGEAERYADDYNATVTQTGAEGAYSEIEKVKNLIEDFKDRGITLTVNASTGTFAVSGHGYSGHLASGGYITGPGGPTDDRAGLYALSNGEYVVKAAAVAKYGRNMMELINAGRMPAYGGPLSHLKIETDSSNVDRNALAGDFIEKMHGSIGKSAAAAGKKVFGGEGKVLPPGSYRIGRGAAAHGYNARDLAAPTGTPIFAAAAGIVSRAARLATSYGIHAAIQHAGWRTLYAHMSQMYVSAGQTVGKGQMIGRVGSTGNSTGPHLHLEPDRPSLYDGGGWWNSGTLGANLSGRPEAVLSPDESQAFYALVSAVESMRAAPQMAMAGSGAAVYEGDTTYVVNGTQEELVHKLAARQAYDRKLRGRD